MQGLSLEEQFTLELIAEQGPHTVLEGGALAKLASRGLVALAEDGWDMTPLGLFAIQDIAA